MNQFNELPILSKGNSHPVIWARGGVDVLYLSQIVDNGDLKSEGGVNEPLRTRWLTTTPRPQEMQVVGMVIRRGHPTILCPGTRSGAEASSPTGDAGCLGEAGLRRPVLNLL